MKNFVRGLDHHKVKNLIGMKFGSLTVLNVSTTGKLSGRSHWFCKCDCGNARMCVGTRLIKGSLKYCSRRCPFKPKPKYTKPSYRIKKVKKIFDDEKQKLFLAQNLGISKDAVRGSNFKFRK